MDFKSLTNKITQPLFFRSLIKSAVLFMILFLSGCLGSKQTETNPRIINNPDYIAINKEKPDQPNYLSLARTLVKKGYFDIALVQLEKALEMSGKNPEIFFLMGSCHRGKKNYTAALISFNKSIRIDPDYAPSYNGMGILCDLTGNATGAIKNFSQAIKINPARPDFHNNIGFSLLCTRNFKKAQQYFKTALTLDSGFFLAKHNLALCMGLSGNTTDALDLLNSTFSPAAAMNNMGAIYRLKNNNEKADMFFTNALSIDSNLKAAKKNLSSQKKEL